MSERSDVLLRRSSATAHVTIGNVTTPIARSLPRRLLGVWAHPDDECYLSAGLMSRVVAAGGEVRVVCATRGELGAPSPDSSVGVVRSDELRSSLAMLGVHDLHLLDLADGSCADADDAHMVDVVAAHVVDFAADAVVTFGPDGITGHPDHVAVSRWATAAAASDVEVLYATMTHAFVERHRDLHEGIGLFADLPGRRPRSVATGDVALQVSLDHAELIRKRRALAEHRSQTAPLAELVGESTYFSWWRDECFRRPTRHEVERTMVGAGRTAAGVGA